MYRSALCGDLVLRITSVPDKESISQLPIEVLEEILIRIEKVHDLLNCRLVSKTWHKCGSSASRRLYVRIKAETFNQPRKFDKFCNRFIAPAEQGLLPWSGISIPASTKKSTEIDGYTPAVEVLIHQFLDNFGQFVREVRLIGTAYDVAMEILGRLNNLEKIICNLGATRSDKTAKLGNIEVETNEPIEEPIQGSLNLRQLKTVHIDINYLSSFQFFQYLIGHTSRKLKHVRISLDSYHPGSDEIDEKVNKIACSLTEIESVSVSCRNESIRYMIAFASKGLKIRETSIYFSRYHPTQIDFDTLETFLRSSGPYLGKLSFECYRNISTTEVRKLKMPILPKLRRLKLIHCLSGGYFTSQQGSIPASFQFFYPFTTIELPQLAEVDIEYNGSCILFNNARFQNVNFLRVIHSPANDPMKTLWSKIFPNLRILKTRVNEGSLISIFTNFTDLESLYLDLSTCNKDVNLLLTGLPDSVLRTQEEVNEYRKSQKVPSLLSMTGLSKLFLHFGDCNQIGESGVKFALLQIQPLETLGLTGATISPSLACELASYHNRFETSFPGI